MTLASSVSPPSCSFELLGGPLGDGPASIEHHDSVGEALGLLHVLSGEQHGGAGRDQLLDELPQVVAGPGIEPGGRLVEEQHRRSGDEAGTDVQPAPHPPE